MNLQAIAFAVLTLAVSATAQPPLPAPPPGGGNVSASDRGPREPQGPPAKDWEAVSIKPGDPNNRQIRMMINPGRLSAQNVTVKDLLQQAYGVKEFQLVGLPGWASNERFVIEGKLDGVFTRDSMQPLMQKLLEDRFGLKIHKDSKEGAIYHLVVAKNGAKLKDAEAANRERNFIRMGRGMISGGAMNMDQLAEQLSRNIGRQVVNKTGLTGQYEVKLEWTPDQGPGPRELNSDAAAPVDTSGPTIFNALQEQLGLKLDNAKGPVDMIVIDKLEKPSEN